MAYAPFNSGPYQGRAIRLGSSRSLKVYRGVRELGSSDPVLIIHDAFDGSGKVNGRTPDTVDNGNTWTTYPSGRDFDVQSGYAALDLNGTATAYIPVSQSAFTIETEIYANSVTSGQFFLHEILTSFDPVTGAKECFRFDRQYFYFRKFDGSTTTDTLIYSHPSILNSVTLESLLEISSSLITYDIKLSGVTLTSGTVTPSYTPQNPGFWMNRYVSSQDCRCLDFKVYTPPVEATRKIVLDFGGVFDNRSGNGAGDNNPVFSKPSTGFSGLLFFAIRSPYGFVFSFNTSADRSSFLASYPSNFGQITYVDTYSNTQMTTQSGWSWTNWDAFGQYRCYINSTSINNFFVPSDGSPLIGQSYTLIAF